MVILIIILKSWFKTKHGSRQIDEQKGKDLTLFICLLQYRILLLRPERDNNTIYNSNTWNT
ncbi:hypothetical protein FACS1894199_09600 [Bacteroidia bacterium]|nr:hypothetical protein FACS1894199_09600 [Bacteroidia bacterium]